MMNLKTISRIVAASASAMAVAGAAHAADAAPAAEWAPSAPTGGRFAYIDATDVACRPYFPERALRARTQGTTHLAYKVDAAGKIAGGAVVQHSGTSPEHHLLDQSALNAIARCPVTVGTDAQGQPAATTVSLDYTWRLN
jgi:TonB family protein